MSNEVLVVEGPRKRTVSRKYDENINVAEIEEVKVTKKMAKRESSNDETGTKSKTRKEKLQVGDIGNANDIKEVKVKATKRKSLKEKLKVDNTNDTKETETKSKTKKSLKEKRQVGDIGNANDTKDVKVKTKKRKSPKQLNDVYNANDTKEEKVKAKKRKASKQLDDNIDGNDNKKLKTTKRKSSKLNRVQCTNCMKWRMMPTETIDIPLPENWENWVCSNNTWNPDIASCDANEEPTAPKRKKQKKDDTEELLKFAFDVDDGIIPIQIKQKIKKEQPTVPNPTSVKVVNKSNDFISLQGSFPQRLHQIIARESKNNIISWSVDGTSFVISDLTFFLTNTSTHYFENMHYKKFTERMGKYGFQRIEAENLSINEKLNTRTYYHPKFQRDDYEMVKEIVNKDAKGIRRESKTPEPTTAESYFLQSRKKSKRKFNNSASDLLQIDGNDIIGNYEREHEIDRPNFYHDIQEMMFGFGDNWPPNRNATLLTDRLVSSYVTELAQRAEIVAETTGKLDKECFLYLVRKDEYKFSRVMTLINTNEQLRTIKEQNIDEDDDDYKVHDDADY